MTLSVKTSLTLPSGHSKIISLMPRTTDDTLSDSPSVLDDLDILPLETFLANSTILSSARRF
jgi:hypothetical protein